MSSFNSTDLASLYNTAFNCIGNAKNYEKSGQLVQAKSSYLKGIENFMKIVKTETNTSKRELIKENLKQFMEKAEEIQQQIQQMNNNPNILAFHNTSGGQPVQPITQPTHSYNPSAPSIPYDFTSPYNPAISQPTHSYNTSLPSMPSSYNPVNNPSIYNNIQPYNPLIPSQPYNPNIPQPQPQPQHQLQPPSQPYNPSAPPLSDNNDDGNDALALLNGLDLPDPPSINPQIDLPDPPSNEGVISGGAGAGGDGGGGGNGGGSDNILFDKAQGILDEAIEFDQHSQYQDASLKYKEASQLFLDALTILNDKITVQEKKKYRDKVATIIGRIELLAKLIEQEQMKSAARINQGVANEGLSKKEIQVLRRSSYIRNLVLMPWMESDGSVYHNDDDDLYIDKTGLLPLSLKQKNKFGKWKRIKNISSKPTIVSIVTPYSITQTLISDCSFVSSLTVTALYEKIFKKKLITSIIYPQYSLNGKPLYNKYGKYVVKLFINGCYRKIEIDDYLPVSQSGKLLCSFSNNKHEFWVSLIEKAFLKVMGGYDFPGSTSSEDLHVLTGWIPERIGLHDGNKQLKDVNKMFGRLVSGSKYGDCLITLSSKKMTDDEADKLGLVPTHAYAVLRVEQLGTHKFILLKNPWATLRWKGRFSADDNNNWTPQLRKALKYNPQKEKQFDNGIFWMEYSDVVKHFSAIFLNWNPELFTWRITQHGYWDKNDGPKNDSYNLGYNPQYSLDVYIDLHKEEEKVTIPLDNDNSANNDSRIDVTSGSVWILLSKHMVNTKREEQDKNDFLTLHVYDETSVTTRDRRVFYRKNALYTGVYINSPHYLMKLDVDGKVFTKKQIMKNKKNVIHKQYTVIISQYEKKHDVSFTITAYSTLPSRFKPIDDAKSWKYRRVLMGKWNKKYSGGSPNHATYPSNPQFKIKSIFKTHLRFILEAPIDYSVNIQLYLCTNDIDDNNDNTSAYDNDANLDQDNDDLDINPDDDDDVKAIKGGKILTKADYSKDLLVGDSGPYRYGVCMTDCLNIEAGTYIAIVSTFKPGQLGPFKFSIKSVENLELKVV